VQSAPPHQNHGSQPSLVPALGVLLAQLPLDRREGGGTDELRSGGMNRSSDSKNGLETGVACEGQTKGSERHASNRAIRRLRAMPATWSTAARGSSTKRPNMVSSSTLKSWGLVKRR